MHKLSALVMGIALVLGAEAAQAVDSGFTGQISLRILTLPPIVIPAAGGAVSLNGSGSFGHLTQLDVPAGIFQGTGVPLPITDPGSAPIKGVQLTVANSAGSFQGEGGSGGFGGMMAIHGFGKVCLFGPCSNAVANLKVPLEVVGTGGTAYAAGAVNLTIEGAPWTTGTVAVGTATAMGTAMGPPPPAQASATASPGGKLRLVSPLFISTNIGASAVVPAFVIMDIQIPEPGQLSVMLASITGLVGCGMIKSRRQRHPLR